MLMFAVSTLRLDQCLELLIRTNRLPEAAFLARTYLPSQVSRCLLNPTLYNYVVLSLIFILVSL